MTTQGPNSGSVDLRSLPTAIKKRWFGIAQAIVFICVLVPVTFFALREWWRHSAPLPTLVVSFDNLHGLRAGSPLELDGLKVGSLATVSGGGKAGKWKAAFHLKTTPEIAAQLKRSSTRVYIDHLQVGRLRVRGANRAVYGPAAVVLLGTNGGKAADELNGVSDGPPDPRLPVEPIEVALRFADAHGVERNAPVKRNGVEIGIVQSVTPVPDGAAIQIALFESDPKKCPELIRTTRYYVDNATISPRGVEGDGSTLLYGAHIVVVPDPLFGGGAPQFTFSGEEDPPPKFMPEAGEKELRVESLESIPADTPLSYFGEPAGYVHSSRPARDGNSFFVRVRVYRWVQPLFTAETKLFMEPKFRAQLFKNADEIIKLRNLFRGESPLDFKALQGPKLEIPYPAAIFRPGIEFRTPPGAAQPFSFEDMRAGQFMIYREPQDEWLLWRPSLPTAEARKQVEAFKLPTPVPVNLVWRKKVLFGTAQGGEFRQTGLALQVEGGLLAINELLVPAAPEKELGSANLEVGGKAAERSPVKSIGSDLSIMPLNVAAENIWPVSSLGRLEEPADLAIVLARGYNFVDAQRLVPNEGNWKLLPGAGFGPSWHGAPAVSCSGKQRGKVVGFIRITETDGVSAASLVSSPTEP